MKDSKELSINIETPEEYLKNHACGEEADFIGINYGQYFWIYDMEFMVNHFAFNERVKYIKKAFIKWMMMNIL